MTTQRTASIGRPPSERVTKANTIRKGTLGKTELALVSSEGRFYGLADRRIVTEGDDADDVWRRLHDEAGKANPSYFGFSGARARFLHWFREGFESAAYTASERDYKVAAKRRLDEAAPVEAAATGSGFGEAALAAFRATNLLYPVEKSRMQAVLRGPDADTFVRAAARFALGETRAGLAAMERALKPHDNARWTAVTYLPFLWRPDQHMFLKPAVTQDFAARVGHRFVQDYEARLMVGVYESLLDLVGRTETEISDLKPRDRIDVQSFIWVVGDYREDRETPQP